MNVNKVINVLAETFKVNASDLNPDTTMENIDSWDSLTHMEMIANLECEFDIEFTNDDIIAMTTVSAICKAVEDKL